MNLKNDRDDIKQSGSGIGIKGVIFDVDGVLLDSLSIWHNLGARYLISKGKMPKEGLNDILFSMSMEQGAAYLHTHYLPDMTQDSILEGIQGMLRDFYYEEVQAKPGMNAFLKELKTHGIRITAATSSPRSHVEKALERNGLRAYIERIYTTSEIGSSKHSPAIYDAAAAFMNLTREETCVFEDSLYALKTADKAGYHTVGIYDKDGEPDQKGLEEIASVYIRDEEDLLEALARV